MESQRGSGGQLKRCLIWLSVLPLAGPDETPRYIFRAVVRRAPSASFFRYTLCEPVGSFPVQRPSATNATDQDAVEVTEDWKHEHRTGWGTGSKNGKHGKHGKNGKNS